MMIVRRLRFFKHPPHRHIQTNSKSNTATTRSSTLSLYRRILRAAEHFPSKNAPKITQSIREEFREKALVVDPVQVALCHETALRGLEQLERYTEGIDRRNPNWVVNMEKNPMPSVAALPEEEVT